MQHFEKLGATGGTVNVILSNNPPRLQPSQVYSKEPAGRQQVGGGAAITGPKRVGNKKNVKPRGGLAEKLSPACRAGTHSTPNPH